jgi:glycosyltransferase involved in cell wall biosynthesis
MAVATTGEQPMTMPAPSSSRERATRRPTAGRESVLHAVPRGGSYRQVSEHTPTVTVVIPTRNEAGNVRHVLERIPSWIDEVIVVDASSTDGTVDEVLNSWPDAIILKQVGKGKGGALVQGFAAATCDIIVMLDADGSTDPAEIPRFIAALRTGGDFAKGTRFVTGGGSADITRSRALGNRFLRTLVNRIWGARFTDLCYGYNAFWRRCLPDLAVNATGFEVETLLAVRALQAKVRVVEVPSYESHRISGASNLNAVRDGIRILRTIMAEWLRPN